VFFEILGNTTLIGGENGEVETVSEKLQGWGALPHDRPYWGESWGGNQEEGGVGGGHIEPSGEVN